MIKPALLSSVALVAILTPALAQPAPFDMTPESGLVEEVAPSSDPTVPDVEAPPALPSFSRYLLPAKNVRLSGEEAREGVVVYLTGEQAAAPARLEFSYLNALVVAPEMSNLRVRINQTEVTTTPIASSSAPAAIAVDIPAGLLRAGANIVEFHASQRHRTDCTVDSTYQLWTEITGADARLVFEGEDVSRIAQLADLGAVGVNADGQTTLRIIGAGLSDPMAQSVALHAVQQIGIALRTPELAITMAEAPSSDYEPGVLDLLIMPADALPAEFAAARPQASAAPLAAMVPTTSGATTLVLSGPNWESIARAGDALEAAAPAAGRPRVDLPLPVPMMEGGDSASLASLGFDRLEFNGRRYAARLDFELPSDFYGYRYGELELALDAAYSSDVLPGSEIDIYMNGEIASATPVLRTDGGALKNTHIRIPMTSLRPGRNEAVVTINLLARSDAACGAGWTGSAPVRFVMSNSSYFRLPDYARATAVPDLLVVTGSGWPYADAAPVPLALGQGEPSLVSAMMFATRVATASGRVINFDVVAQTELPPESNAMLVMPMGTIAPLNQTRIDIATGQTGTAVVTSEPLGNQFGNNEDEGGAFAPVRNWIRNALGLDVADLQLFPGTDADYAPRAGAVVVSQTLQPEGGIWTTLTAASGEELVAGTERLIETEKWRQISGRISALEPNAEEVTTIAAENVAIRTDEPLSAPNARRIAANWFSGNILYFTIAVVLGSILLMGVTSRLLTRIGRTS